MNKLFTLTSLCAVFLLFASASSCGDAQQVCLDSDAQVAASADIPSPVHVQDEPTAENVAPAATTGDRKSWDEVKAQALKSGIVNIRTDKGSIKVRLFDETPIHKENFLKLAYEGYYDSLMFHRVMNQFMAQGGDPQSKTAGPGARLGMGSPGYTLENEIQPGLMHHKGALAAARQGQNNPTKRSNGGQFYIVHGKKFQRAGFAERQIQANARRPEGEHVIYTEEDLKAYETIGGYPSLDGEYTVFGEVLEGLDVLDAIAVVKVDGSNRPFEDIRMYMTVEGLE